METEWKKVANGKLYMFTKEEDYYLRVSTIFGLSIKFMF